MYIPRTPTAFLAALAAFVTASCSSLPDRAPPLSDIRLLDAAGQPLRGLSIGENVEVGATGLVPGRGYEFDLVLEGRRIGFARASADRAGAIRPLILWYQSGVIGCSGDWRTESARRPVAYRSFDEAGIALQGRTLDLLLREAAPARDEGDRTGRPGRLAFRPSASRAIASARLPASASQEPMVFPSTSDGCLLNSAEARDRDMFVSGRGFRPGETLELAVVSNQIEWHVGDAIVDQPGAEGRVRVKAGANGRFTARVWDRARQQRGAYDIITRRLDIGPVEAGGRRVRAQDVISFGHDTAYLLFLYYPPGGTQMDIAGRTVWGFPYFQFADSFATTNDNVWGGVDPTYVAPSHPGGTYAAYYVVNHRNATGAGSWANTTNLADVSGVVEISPVKAGCINGTYMPIWNGPLPIGNYDAVVNFGSVPAMSSAAFVDDFNYDAALDFLDGAIQIGFVVAPDPNELGPMAVGQTSYSADDVLTLSSSVSSDHGPNIGTGPNVDLRAVVRYPATAAGVDTPVAAGAHPLFIIQHGNHEVCNVPLVFPQEEHVDCPVGDRERNHEGYMRLLDVLASHGVIAVSVDAFDLTGGVPPWIDERGDLNLKHLEFWAHLDNPANYASYATLASATGMAGRFTNHVDMAKISVSGHSRGGEASVSTFVRNLLRPSSQQFSITSVSSIAPTDFDGHTLGNVPYFVIIPAADGDVSDLDGIKIYDRAGGAAETSVKSGIDVYGASHNLFNTVWAGDGDDGIGGTSRADYILPAAQQKIGEAYLAAFVLRTLRGMTAYDDMLRGRMGFPSTAGSRFFHFRHDQPFLKLDSGTASNPNATGAASAGLANATALPYVHDTSVRQLTWNTSPQTFTYTLTAPTDVSVFEVLTFRVAQTILNPVNGFDFQVTLASGGTSRYTYAGRFDQIPPPYDRSGINDHEVMTNVRIPLHSFIMNNSNVNLAGIDTVKMEFYPPTPGRIYVDDVEFSR